MTAARRWWRWAFGIAFVPALALAQATPNLTPEQEQRRHEENVRTEPRVTVSDPVQKVTAESYRRSEKPPGPSDPIPVRKNFQPELGTSQQNID